LETSLQQKAFFLLLAIVSVAFFWLLLPFFGAVFWAVILAIVFAPLQRSFERRFGPRSNLAAALSLLVCIVLAIIPMALILGSLVNEGSKLVQRVQSGAYDTSTLIDDIQAAVPPRLQQLLDRLGAGDFDALQDRLVSLAQQFGQLVAGRALNLGQNTLRFVASTGIMLYVLFFLFRDGRLIARNVRASMPLSEEHNHRLLEKFTAVVRATVKGNIVIAVIQGTIGGLAFWFLGIQAALLWGTLMIFLSLLPAVGAAIVWVPVAAYFLLTGEVWKGVVLIGIGAGVIGLVDNLLRPTLVGKDTRLPDYVILVSTVGGLSLFGINGFVIGPLIAALFVAGWTIFREERTAVEERELEAAGLPHPPHRRIER
jgi:predicted PurR-regulated permease PerM